MVAQELAVVAGRGVDTNAFSGLGGRLGLSCGSNWWVDEAIFFSMVYGGMFVQPEAEHMLSASVVCWPEPFENKINNNALMIMRQSPERKALPETLVGPFHGRLGLRP